ncbi:hypothetical protein [Fluviibacter sp.]
MAFLPQWALASDGDMTHEAKIGQSVQNALYRQIQLPISYNYNQNLGAANNTTQGQFQFNPVIPLAIDGETTFIIRPMLTGNFNNQDKRITNQTSPLQLEAFMAWDNTLWAYGVGPYFQAPAANANNGSMQTGMGVSAAGYFKPDHWNIGGILYKSWGVGNDMSGGSANVFSVSPGIAYTTNHAWTYSLSSQIVYNVNTSTATNQLTLSCGKTIRIFDEPVQVQVGPTYMVTHTAASAKGFGGYLALTWVIRDH